MPRTLSSIPKSSRATTPTHIAHYEVNPPIRVMWRLIRWLVKHPLTVSVFAISLAVWYKTQQWQFAVLAFCISVAMASGIALACSPSLFTAGLWPSITALSRKRKLQKRWAQACIDSGLFRDDKTKFRIPKLFKLKVTKAGNVTAIINAGNVGKTAENVSSVSPVLAAVTKCPYVEVRNGNSHPGIAFLEFRWRDELARKIIPNDIAHTPHKRNRLCFGVAENGQPISIDIETSTLFVGLTRSGKSNTVWALLAWLNKLKVPYRLWVIDPKGGMEMRGLQKASYRYAVTDTEIRLVLSEAVTEMQAQQKVMAEQNIRKFNPRGKLPLNLLIVDEFLALTTLARGTDKRPIQTSLNTLMSQGAASGYIGWFCTQVAQVDTLGRIRTFIPQRLCFATDTIESAIAALGASARVNGRCDLISLNTPGIGYMSKEGSRELVRFRSVQIKDADVAEIASGRWPSHKIIQNDKPRKLGTVTSLSRSVIAAGRKLGLCLAFTYRRVTALLTRSTSSTGNPQGPVPIVRERASSQVKPRAATEVDRAGSPNLPTMRDN